MEKAGEEPPVVTWGGGWSRQPSSLGGTLENKNNPMQRGYVCVKERERKRERGRGRKEEQEKATRNPDGGSVTNGDAAATCEAKVPAFVARLYVRDGHKFRLVPIKPWKWELGQNNRGLRISRGTLRHFRIRRSLSPPFLFALLRFLCPAERLWQAASPRTFLTTHPHGFSAFLYRAFPFLFLAAAQESSVRRLEKSKRRVLPVRA